MTQQELADALNITRSLVLHYERNCSNPASDFVLRVSKVLDVSLDELFDLKPEKVRSGPSPRVKKLTQRLTELPKAKQSFVLEMLESYIDKAS